MEYLKIKNWDRWQSYRSDRGQPPWIKVHRCVMRNPEWVELTDSERGQLIAMWLLAADNNGLIPSSPILIHKLCFMTTPLKLNKFIELGFLCQSDASLTPEGRQVDPPEKSRVDKRREDKKDKYSEYVFLTKNEYTKLIEKYSKVTVDNKIEDLNNYIGSKGKKYKSHYHTILSWLRKEAPKDEPNNFQPPLEDILS